MKKSIKLEQKEQIMNKTKKKKINECTVSISTNLTVVSKSKHSKSISVPSQI